MFKPTRPTIQTGSSSRVTRLEQNGLESAGRFTRQARYQPRCVNMKLVLKFDQGLKYEFDMNFDIPVGYTVANPGYFLFFFFLIEVLR